MNGKIKPPSRRRTRREFLAIASGSVAASVAGVGPVAQAQAPARKAAAAAQSRPNILFIFTDQERYQRKLAPGLSLPAHERLQRTGVTFHNHYTGSTMCTSSRAVMLTGLTTVDNRMFENTDVAWVGAMSTKIPTIGHMLRKAGYYTAYKGKWHLSPKFDVEDPRHLLTKEMEQYGFSDFNSVGDMIAKALGGYEFDHLTSGGAVTWLRRKGQPLSAAGKPWCLTVSLVNPHDIMYFNTDLPGEKVQDTGVLFFRAAPAPDNQFFKAEWDVPVANSLKQPFDMPGRPKAHHEFNEMWSYVLGRIPLEEERWRRFDNFYINCIRSVDQQVETLLNELDALRLTDRTIVIFTSDHGELAGAHGLHGKGPFAYEEGIHLPFYMVHPDVKGGQECRSLTSHIDFVPTLLAMAGVDATKRSEIAGRHLPGKDLTPLLTNPGAADLHAARDAVLFTYSGLVTNDSGIWQVAAEAKAVGRRPALAVLKQRYVPDMKKRGTLRTAFDGRYKFTRYFSPLDHNSPKTLDELYQWNDVELFDLNSDPAEMTNLAADKTQNGQLISMMNGKLSDVIDAEIGVDNGRELPNIPLVDWTINRIS